MSATGGLGAGISKVTLASCDNRGDGEQGARWALRAARERQGILAFSRCCLSTLFWPNTGIVMSAAESRRAVWQEMVK